MMDLLGWGEWLVIAILALIIVGPKDLPRLFFILGRWIRRLRESTAGIREEFEGLMRLEQIKEYQEKVAEEAGEDDQAFFLNQDLLPFSSAPSRSKKPAKGTKRQRKSA
ncbi:MAG: Sec-independent protein translocase protein TatB [Holosporales bacterium]|jgi:sec-independent protein translocase protein TatB